MTPKYDAIATIIATSHAGAMVFLWYPTPNCLRDPSALYINAGLLTMMIAYTMAKIAAAIVVMCLRAKARFMLLYVNDTKISSQSRGRSVKHACTADSFQYGLFIALTDVR